MTWFHVGMNQAAVIPIPCKAYEGLQTYGLDGCTGLVVVGPQHLFLAHIPPIGKGNTFHLESSERKQITGDLRWLLHEGLSRMSKFDYCVIVNRDAKPDRKLRQDYGPWKVRKELRAYFIGRGLTLPRLDLQDENEVRVDLEGNYRAGFNYKEAEAKHSAQGDFVGLTVLIN
jgi:hypothetical protein